MKKLGLFCLALIIALGALGFTYASWHNAVSIAGPVTTGTVCVQFAAWEDGPPPVYVTEEFSTPDRNFTAWVSGAGPSCPPLGRFSGVHQTNPGKDIGYLESVTPQYDINGHVEQLDITINNAYPYFLCYLTVLVQNCGSIPVKINTPIINQDPSLLIEYFDGEQIEPGGNHEISFRVGVTQYVGHYVDGVWVIDDPSQPLTPQNATLSFSIEIEADQWYEP